MLVTLSPDRLGTGATDLSDALERGNILYYPQSPVPLPSEEDRALLCGRLANTLTRKNVSYFPRADRLVGLRADPAMQERVQAILRAHLEDVRSFLARTMPGFARGSTTGTCSFRPIQARGRNLKPRASDELVHIDAGAYGATHGDRILRFFVNLNPVEPRVWSTRGPFPDIYARYGRRAGIADGAGRAAVEDGVMGRLRTRVLRAIEAGIPMARMLDSSRYDRRMRQLHNYMKESPEFREGADGFERYEFPPYSAWEVLTDMVSHACLSGQYALVTTFIIPLANCRLRELAPYEVLQHPPEASVAS